MIATLGVLLSLNILAVTARSCGGRSLLNLGANVDAERVGKALKICAKELIELQMNHIQERCESLNALDLHTITSAAGHEAVKDISYLRPLPSWRPR